MLIRVQTVSFVIPCYKSSLSIGHVVAEIHEAMSAMNQYKYEIILVNDCSPDNTFEVIGQLCEQYPNIIGINLAKNFGQHAALMAGYHYVSGDIVVCLDDDGQTPANEVGKLLESIDQGNDVVYAKYCNKQHSSFRNFGSKLNELMTRIMLGKPKDLYLSSYFGAKRFVIDNMIEYENSYPYVVGLVLRATKRISNVEVTHRERELGTSGYNMKKLMGLWFNGFTAFSIKPLRMATIVGTTCAAAGFIYGIFTIIKKIVNPEVMMGFSSLMAGLMFIGGTIMIMLGFIGEYIGRIYISINNSPQYVIREMVESKKN